MLRRGLVHNKSVRGFVRCSTVSPLAGADLERPNCALSVRVEGMDLEAPVAGLLGSYWVSRGVGLVGFAAEGDGGEPWGLVELSCEPVEACDGEW